MSAATALTCARAVQVAENLPSSPRVLADLQERLRDPNTSFDDVTELLQRDAGANGAHHPHRERRGLQ